MLGHGLLETSTLKKVIFDRINPPTENPVTLFFWVCVFLCKQKSKNIQ